jgi:hypothetical protein
MWSHSIGRVDLWYNLRCMLSHVRVAWSRGVLLSVIINTGQHRPSEHEYITRRAYHVGHHMHAGAGCQRHAMQTNQQQRLCCHNRFRALGWSGNTRDYTTCGAPARRTRCAGERTLYSPRNVDNLELAGIPSLFRHCHVYPPFSSPGTPRWIALNLRYSTFGEYCHYSADSVILGGSWKAPRHHADAH